MLRFPKRKTDRVRLILSADDAVDLSTPEALEGFRRYRETLDERHLTLRGQPVRWVLRPLTVGLFEDATESPGAGRGQVRTERRLLQAVVEDVVPWPADLGPREEAMQDGRLTDEIARDMVLPAWRREILATALATMPTNEITGKGEQADPFGSPVSGAPSGSSCDATDGTASTPTAESATTTSATAADPCTSPGSADG